MKDCSKALIALIAFNCVLISTLGIVVEFGYTQYKVAKERAIGTVNLRTFRDSAPLPASIVDTSTDKNNEAFVKFKEVKKVAKVKLKTDNDLIQRLSNSNFLGKYVITFYSTETCVPGKVCHTATGTVPKHMHTAAVDPNKIPLGSSLYVEGFGVLKAEDTGSAIKGNRIDIYIANHAQAIKLGRQMQNVYVINNTF